MTLAHIWDSYTDGDYLGSLRQSVQTLADHAGIDLLHIAGLSLMNLRRCDEAVALLRAAITLRPQAPHIYVNAAYLSETAGLKHEAEHFAEAGLKDFPDHPDLLLLKANSLVMQMRFDAAEPVYRALLERDPDNVQSMINLGNICRSRDDFAGAKAWFARAEGLERGFRDLIFARATMHTQLGEDAAALALLEPIADDVDAQFLLALLYLAQGDYERGFRLYRARCNAIWYKTGNFVYPLDPFDHWTEAAGKRIAVIQEGGFGDMVQFVRYIPKLAEVAASITLFTPPSLRRLLHHLPSNVSLEASYESYVPGSFDYVTTDVEMPYHFRSTIESIPSEIPYLFVPKKAIKKRRLPPPPRCPLPALCHWPECGCETPRTKRVGLCWAGGAQDHLNQRSYDNRRSIDLSMYAPLASVPNVQFVSLQLGPRADQTCEALPLLRPLDDSFDFLDTAAVIAQLDLVISVDTVIAHLAAAIGTPVWLLSRYDACWRWTKNRPESVWYPGVLRVFGQETYRDWSKPIQQITEALRSMA
jgi:cytochrome c-type biogenesis protein CcmH/NrfG